MLRIRIRFHFFTCWSRIRIKIKWILSTGLKCVHFLETKIIMTVFHVGQACTEVCEYSTKREKCSANSSHHSQTGCQHSTGSNSWHVFLLQTKMILQKCSFFKLHVSQFLISKTLKVDNKFFKIKFSMLGTFPKTFSQTATSQGYFPKWQLPKCAISQATTSHVCPSRSDRPGPYCSLQRLKGKLPLGKLHICEVVTLEIDTW